MIRLRIELLHQLADQLMINPKLVRSKLLWEAFNDYIMNSKAISSKLISDLILSTGFVSFIIFVLA